MNTQVMKIIPIFARQQSYKPETARGRALHTVDWFLNGTLTQHSYDKPGLNLAKLNKYEVSYQNGAELLL